MSPEQQRNFSDRALEAACKFQNRLVEMKELADSLAEDVAMALIGCVHEPADTVSVPGEPTKEMVNAAEALDWGNEDVRGNIFNLWNVMLAAAPTVAQEPINTATMGGAPKALLHVLESLRGEVDRGWNEAAVAHIKHAIPLARMIVIAQSDAELKREPLTDAEVREWWGSENGLEDHDLCKIGDFAEVVRAVEAKLGITKGGAA